MRFAPVAGNANTARIDGISAAGADSNVMVYTPSADLEIVTYGQPVQAPVVPVSPSGRPTPAIITHAVRELLEFEMLAINAGLASPTCSPTVAIGDNAGRDIRHPQPVSTAQDVFEAAHQLGSTLPDDE